MLGDIIVPWTMLNIRTINATLEKIIFSWIAPNKEKTNLILQTMQIQKSTHCMMTPWRVKLKKWKAIQCKVDLKIYELPNSHLIQFNNVLLQLVCMCIPTKKNIKPTAIQCFCIFWNLWYYFIFPRYCCSWIPSIVSNISCFMNVHIQFQHQHTFKETPSWSFSTFNWAIKSHYILVFAIHDLNYITCNIK